jgi:soluble P-type ATPase
VTRQGVRVDIGGFGRLTLAHLVLDYNGTLAVDGAVLPGVKPRVRKLGHSLRVHVVTADTFGKARASLRGVDCELHILAPGDEDGAKADYVQRLGANCVACIGNGRNDRLMLKRAALGIATIQREGAAGEALRAADIVVHDVRDALDLLLEPRRLVATLRA